jgi:hypothetical protein
MRVRLLLSSIVAIGMGSFALAQDAKNALVGAWELISSTDKNGDGTPRWGENPKGTFIFEPNGRYAFVLVRSDMKKFAANAIDKGTPEENAIAMRGALAHFGTYTYDPQSKTMTTTQEGSNYPNLSGVVAKRQITALTADEMRYTNNATATNGVAEVVWRKVK